MSGLGGFYLTIAGLLVLTVIGGLWRVLRGPDAADRLMAAQLLGTTAAAILLLMAEGAGTPTLRYVALVFASLAVVTIAAFVRLAWTDDAAEDDVDAL